MVFIVGDTLRHQPMVVGHMAVPQFRGPITYCVLQWCHPMLTVTQRWTSCSTRMITLYGDHVIKLDSGPRIVNTASHGLTILLSIQQLSISVTFFFFRVSFSSVSEHLPLCPNCFTCRKDVSVAVAIAVIF